MSWFEGTFGNPSWLRSKEEQLRQLVPEEFTTADDQLMLRVAFALKVMGVMWTDLQHDIPRVMTRLTQLGIVQMKLDGPVLSERIVAVRRNPQRITAKMWEDAIQRHVQAKVAAQTTEEQRRQAEILTNNLLNDLRTRK